MEIKAKTISLLVKAFAVIFVIGCSFLKWFGILQSATITEICMVAGVISAIFGDISINTALDKFTKRGEE